MNNKKGGWGAKLLLVIILMLASAVGGAYGYRILDGKMAINDAKKAIEDVDISDYDTDEQTTIQGFIDEATKDLEKCQTRKDVYEVLGEFIEDVSKVKTKKDKELEEALRQAENARNKADQDSGTSKTDNTGNTGNNTNTTDDGGNYKSNNLNQGSDEKDDDGFLGSLLGGLSSGSN